MVQVDINMIIHHEPKNQQMENGIYGMHLKFHLQYTLSLGKQTGIARFTNVVYLGFFIISVSLSHHD